jgi:hypothetical protein
LSELSRNLAVKTNESSAESVPRHREQSLPTGLAILPFAPLLSAQVRQDLDNHLRWRGPKL